MKRILSLLLAFTIFLCLPALAEESAQSLTDAGFVGIWIENTGYGTLTIRADGSSTMVYYDGTTSESNWGLTDEGAKFLDGMWLNSPMTLLDENTLNVNNGWAIFTREGFLPTTDQALLLGAVPVGEEGAAFLGKWELTNLIIDGENVDPALFSLAMTIDLLDSGLTVIDDGMEPYTTTWSVSYGSAVVEGDILVLDENDQLLLNTGDGSMVFTRVPAEEELPPAAEDPIPVEEEPDIVEEEPAPQLDPVPVGEEGAPFLGQWTLFSMLIDGDPIDPALFGITMILNFTEDGLVTVTDDLDTQTTTWYVADGAAMVEGAPLTVNEDGLLVLEDEEGSVMFFMHPEEESAEGSEFSDADELLALLELLAQLEGMDDLSALPENHQGFVGEWHLCYLMTGGLTGDLRSMGITGSLSLYSDYTGWLTGIAEEDASWYEDEYGVIRFGESGMPLFLIDAEEDGLGVYLQYGTEAGGCMIFHQDPEAVWTPGRYPLQTPAGAVETTTPAASSGEIRLGTKYVCTSYSAGGVPNDASILGAEYAIFFREDGLADFTLAGFTTPDLGCTVAEDGSRTVHYAGNAFLCVPTEAGIDMDFFGIIYHMVPAE